jgi:anti-sigma factor RsiW
MNPLKPGDLGFVPPGGICCKQCTDALLDYVEGRLPPEQLRAFQEHTGTCQPCAIYLSNYKHITEMASKAGVGAHTEPPGQVPPRVIEAILKARRRRA